MTGHPIPTIRRIEKNGSSSLGPHDDDDDNDNVRGTTTPACQIFRAKCKLNYRQIFRKWSWHFPAPTKHPERQHIMSVNTTWVRGGRWTLLCFFTHKRRGEKNIIFCQVEHNIWKWLNFLDEQFLSTYFYKTFSNVRFDNSAFQKKKNLRILS